MRSVISLVLFGLGITFSITAANADDGALCFGRQVAIPADAISACNRLLKTPKAKADASIFLWRGIHRLEMKDTDQAIADFDRAISISQTIAVAYHWRGEAWMDKKEFDRAIANYDQAIRIAPKDSVYRRSRGLAHLERQDFRPALADFNEAIRLDAKPAGQFRGRAVLFEKLNDFDAAKMDYDKAVSLADTPLMKATFSASRGAFYARRNENKKALADFTEAERLDPASTDFSENRILILVRLLDFETAISSANTVLKTSPDNFRVYNLRGAAWFGKKNYKQAIADFSEAVRLNPKESSALVNRADAYREAGDLDRALSEYDAVLELRDQSMSAAWANRGLVWRAKGNVPAAIESFNEAIRIEPDSPDVYVQRGLAYETLGENAKAEADFRFALGRPGKYLFSDRKNQIAKARLDVLLGEKASDIQRPVSPANNDAAKERRIALVIGNGKYMHSGTLTNPPNDARLISKDLSEMGFEVTDRFDLDNRSMKQVINGFLATAAKAKTAVIFYAGHGMQVNGKNYLVPVDFDINEVRDAAAELIDVDFILSGLDDQIRTNIIILDACRDNPLMDEAKKVAVAGRSISIRSGLAIPSGLGAGATLGAGTLLAFATAPGQVALDGDGMNSPFSSALGRHISTPGIEIQQMLTRVRAEVVAATKNKQVPWSNSSLLGEVYLVRTN